MPGSPFSPDLANGSVLHACSSLTGASELHSRIGSLCSGPLSLASSASVDGVAVVPPNGVDAEASLGSVRFAMDPSCSPVSGSYRLPSSSHSSANVLPCSRPSFLLSRRARRRPWAPPPRPSAW